MKKENYLLILISILTTLTVIAVLIANLFPDKYGSPEFNKFGMTAVLAEIIGLFVLISKKVFQLNDVNVFLTLPENTEPQIDWDNEHCWVIGDTMKEKIKLIQTDVGPAYKVHFNEVAKKKLTKEKVIEFELKEKNGNPWRVGPFNLFDKTRNLQPLGNINMLNYD